MSRLAVWRGPAAAICLAVLAGFLHRPAAWSKKSQDARVPPRSLVEQTCLCQGSAPPFLNVWVQE